MRQYAGACRFVYNQALAWQKAQYEKDPNNKFSYATLANLLPSWKKDAFRTYEADLDGHLSNPTGADKPASAASAVTDSEKPKTLDKADAPRDIVSANDYQLKQALSALKVQQFLLRKAKK
jgi:hypothetical protein